MKTKEVLHSLQQQVTVPVHSTRELAGKVEEAAADKERERHETFQKRQEEGKTKPGDTYEPLRRKPGLRPLESPRFEWRLDFMKGSSHGTTFPLPA
jgi:hypothetical protein